MKIGLYFGSFNPIHVGHLIIGKHIINSGLAEKVWFVVSPQNPLKKANSLLNENDRLHLVRLAIEDDVDFKADNTEFQLPRPSYTIDTLTYLKDKYPQHNFLVVMGSDSFLNLHKWKNADLLLKNYGIIIYTRPGFPIEMTQAENIKVLQAPLLEISSTYIRKLIKEKKSIRYLIPGKVETYISENNYYLKK